MDARSLQPAPGRAQSQMRCAEPGGAGTCYFPAVGTRAATGPPAHVESMRFFGTRPLASNILLALTYALVGQVTLALGEFGGVELRRVV